MTTEPEPKTRNVYQIIAAIQGELAKTGIAKEGVNQAQNYKFRGIDQVYAALSPLLSRHGLCILPRMVGREMHERVSIKPGYKPTDPPKESVLFYVTVEAEFDFVSSEDGTTHTIRTFGEAMDSGDKATNKAMSAAYKYAAFMTFAIPTEGDNDADASTHEVSARRNAPFTPGPARNKTDLKDKARPFWGNVKDCDDAGQFATLVKDNGPLINQIRLELPDWWTGGSRPNGEEYEGLGSIIARKQTEFDAAQAERETNPGWRENPLIGG